MVFTLAPFFDFCISWEDDAAGGTQFFKELCNVDGNADLQWIYRIAYEKYIDIAETKKEMKTSSRILSSNDSNGGTDDDPMWIHVGDDLSLTWEVARHAVPVRYFIWTKSTAKLRRHVSTPMRKYHRGVPHPLKKLSILER